MRALRRTSEPNTVLSVYENSIEATNTKDPTLMATAADFRQYRILAKLPAVPFHGLRHTFAVMCRMAGVDILDLEDIMRHSSSRVTERYAKISPEMLSAKVREAFNSGRSAPILPHDRNA